MKEKVINTTIRQYAYIKELKTFYVSAKLLKLTEADIKPETKIAIIGNKATLIFKLSEFVPGMSIDYKVAVFKQEEVQFDEAFNDQDYAIRITFRNDG